MSDNSTDDELAEIEIQDEFLGLWTQWQENGVSEALNFNSMNKVLDIIHTAPVHYKDDVTHGGRTAERCFCNLCRQHIMLSLFKRSQSLCSFFDEQLDVLYVAWTRVRRIFHAVVDFKTFCLRASQLK